jgi:hypothetical protein
MNYIVISRLAFQLWTLNIFIAGFVVATILLEMVIK